MRSALQTAEVHAALSADLQRYFARRAPATLVDDLVQDTFLRVHQGLAGLRDAERLAPWVMRLAHNVLVDHWRKRREELSADGHAEDDLVVDAVEPFPDATAVVASWLPTHIAQLPAPYREAVRLTELEGLSQAQLARRLGLSASGARSRVQRGRQLLRASLEACCEIGWDGAEVVAVRPRQLPCTGPCG